MSRLASTDWLMLPKFVWEDILLRIGLSSLRDLDSCTQVCRTWNDVIRGRIWENPTNKWGKIIQRRLERSWGGEYSYPSDEKIAYAEYLGINDKHALTINCAKLNFRNERHPLP